tara:strand:+ start:389 stop:1084 length:696 start_codon:yes stop_codon:yes gene_type:complete
MSFIPEVKMDFIPSDNEDDIDEDTGEDNPNFVYEEFDESKDKTQEEIEEDKITMVVEEDVPKAKSKRDGMDVNEIFNMPNDTPIKLTKKGKPRKQRPPMTEAHKEKLKDARVKAMASRKAKAQERKEVKSLDIEEKELLKKQKVKRVQKLKEEVDDETPLKEIVKEQTFTKKDLEDAQLNAIMNYEKIRKSRKEQKKIDQEKNREEEAVRNQLRRAVAPPQQEYNPFGGCY